MHSPGEEQKNRRELLRTIGRALGLGSLAWIGVKVRKNMSSAQANEICGEPNPCRGCRIFEDCTLPQALDAKGGSQEPSHG